MRYVIPSVIIAGSLFAATASANSVRVIDVKTEWSQSSTATITTTYQDETYSHSLPAMSRIVGKSVDVDLRYSSREEAEAAIGAKYCQAEHSPAARASVSPKQTSEVLMNIGPAWTTDIVRAPSVSTVFYRYIEGSEIVSRGIACATFR
jgi:hypothetical protein